MVVVLQVVSDIVIIMVRIIIAMVRVTETLVSLHTCSGTELSVALGSSGTEVGSARCSGVVSGIAFGVSKAR